MTVNCGHCKLPITGNLRTNKHHIIYRSNGGPDSLDNLLTMHRDCHIALHMAKGPDGLSDFQKWGRQGGLITATKPHIWARNLKHVRNDPDRYIEQYGRKPALA